MKINQLSALFRLYVVLSELLLCVLSLPLINSLIMHRQIALLHSALLERRSIRQTIK